MSVVTLFAPILRDAGPSATPTWRSGGWGFARESNRGFILLIEGLDVNR